MSTLRTVVELARGDFLERARRYSFLLTLGATAYLAYTVYAGWWTVRIGAYAAAPGPAWTGTLIAMTTSIPLSLFGFYVVKGTVARDRRTRVGPILAATPTTRWNYALGKFGSNLAVLGSMLGILATLAVAMEGVRSGGLSGGALWPVISPSLLLTLPMLIAIAGLAVLFDSVPWLRGTVGNILYFFLWAGMLTFSVFEATRLWADVMGIGLLHETLGEALLTAHPEATVGGLQVKIGPSSGAPAGRFPWTGIGWSGEHVIRRFAWTGMGFALTGLAALSLRLFDPFRETDTAGSTESDAESDDDPAPQAHQSPEDAPAVAVSTLSAPHHTHPLRAVARMVRAEVRLLVTGHAWWWYGGLVVANGVAFLVPPDTVSHVLLAAWLLPLSAWSSLGCRERIHGTESLLFSAPAVHRRHLSAQYVAGVLLALIAAVGPILRLATLGDLSSLAALGVGALFVPALALCLGAWSGTTTPFEAVYLLLWYLGPLNEVAALDYMGVTNQAVTSGATLHFLVATVLLVLLAWLGRRRRARVTA